MLELRQMGKYTFFLACDKDGLLVLRDAFERVSKGLGCVECPLDLVGIGKGGGAGVLQICVVETESEQEQLSRRGKMVTLQIAAETLSLGLHALGQAERVGYISPPEFAEVAFNGRQGCTLYLIYPQR